MSPFSFLPSLFLFLPLRGILMYYPSLAQLQRFQFFERKDFDHCALSSVPSFCLFKDGKTHETLLLVSVQIIADAVMR